MIKVKQIIYYSIVVTDILALQEIINNDTASLTIEVDDNVKNVEQFLDKYEQKNINIAYERSYRNIKLMVKIL
jgi:hypothetical protein